MKKINIRNHLSKHYPNRVNQIEDFLEIFRTFLPFDLMPHYNRIYYIYIYIDLI